MLPAIAENLFSLSHSLATAANAVHTPGIIITPQNRDQDNPSGTIRGSSFTVASGEIAAVTCATMKDLTPTIDLGESAYES